MGEPFIGHGAVDISVETQVEPTAVDAGAIVAKQHGGGSTHKAVKQQPDDIGIKGAVSMAYIRHRCLVRDSPGSTAVLASCIIIRIPCAALVTRQIALAEAEESTPGTPAPTTTTDPATAAPVPLVTSAPMSPSALQIAASARVPSAASGSMSLQADLDELHEELLTLPGPVLPDDATGIRPLSAASSSDSWAKRHQRQLTGLLALCPLAVVAAGISWIGITSLPSSAMPSPSPSPPPRDNALPRALTIQDGQFYTKPIAGAATGTPVLLMGTNVVMKGHPWLPDSNGTSGCAEPPHCDDMHGCTITCTTFNAADGQNLKRQGYNFVRLGVIWAGAQPHGPHTALDSGWVHRLHGILEVCAAAKIYVILDLHQDALGTALCGEGVPMWLSQLATPDLVGQPLQGVPSSELGTVYTPAFLNVSGGGVSPTDPTGSSGWPTQRDGSCGPSIAATGENSWAEHAAQPDYNTQNPCCRKLNGRSTQADAPQWADLLVTLNANRTMEYLLHGEGQAHYARFTGLLAKVVAQYPFAVGIELFNEPPTLDISGLFTLYEACYRSIRAVNPTLAVGVMHPGQIAVPLGADRHGQAGLSAENIVWLNAPSTKHLFYALHWYGNDEDGDASHAMGDALGFSKPFGMAVLLTEYDPHDCATMDAAHQLGIGSAWWHYANCEFLYSILSLQLHSATMLRLVML